MDRRCLLLGAAAGDASIAIVGGDARARFGGRGVAWALARLLLWPRRAGPSHRTREGRRRLGLEGGARRCGLPDRSRHPLRTARARRSCGSRAAHRTFVPLWAALALRTHGTLGPRRAGRSHRARRAGLTPDSRLAARTGRTWKTRRLLAAFPDHNADRKSVV